MTTRPVRGVEIAEVDEEAVASYLSATPEFFDRHAQLLARIRLPDIRGGASTVSLVERQVEVLRERNRQLERKVKDFVDVARENDVLGIARACDGAPADRSKGRRGRDRRNRVGAPGGIRRGPVGPRAHRRAARRRASRKAASCGSCRRKRPELRSFETLFSSGKPRCGQLRDSQREFLFGADAPEVGSVALVPLGSKGSIGLLACGSNDSHRFNPTMSTDFLGHIGELITAALSGD